jgi:hypothetical protein
MYQSRVDWRPARDILRVNDAYHGASRYDGIIVNSSDMPYARLELVFRLKFPDDGPSFDLALVRGFKHSRWKPATPWDGCRVVEETTPQIIGLEYVERGLLLVSSNLLKPSTGIYYIDDVVDFDMFLRINDID